MLFLCGFWPIRAHAGSYLYYKKDIGSLWRPALELNDLPCPNKVYLLTKEWGACLKFWKEPLRSTKVLFRGCGWKWFSSPRWTNPNTSHYFGPSYFFCELHALKGTVKAPVVNLKWEEKTPYFSKYPHPSYNPFFFTRMLFFRPGWIFLFFCRF